MSNYSKCLVCGHTVAKGHPCMNCVAKKRMKKDEKVISPEQLIEFVKVLRVQEGDTIVIKSSLLCNPDAIEMISTGIKEIIDCKIGLMVLSDDAEIFLLRKEDAK